MIGKILKRGFGSLFGIGAIGLVAYTLFEILSSTIYYDLSGILLGFFSILILSLLACVLWSSSVSDTKQKHRFMISGLILVFVFYCGILLNLLFLGRHFFSHSLTTIWERIKYSTNFIPFRTILRYIIHHDDYNTEIVLQNLFGNLFLLAPMGVFLPILFPKMRKFKFYVLYTFLGILAVEIIQLITDLGFFDVDDIILNLLGAVIFFFILQLPLFKKLYHKMHLM